MKFNEYKYTRPDILKIKIQILKLTDSFKTSTQINDATRIIFQLNTIKGEWYAQYNICHIRHTINTRDMFYENEQQFFNDNNPVIAELFNQFYTVLLKSKLKKELTDKFGQHIFTIANLSLKTISKEVLPLLQKENELATSYTKIKASAEIEFNGNTYNLSNILPLELDKNRDTRKAASEKKWGFYEKNRRKIEEIYDKLVAIRHEIAIKLGYENFIQLGYDRMLRSDYTSKEIQVFRTNIQKHIVPLAHNLYQRQQKRLKLETLTYFDENYHFDTGNPKPKGDSKWIMNHANTMYEELSPETAEFFKYMSENNLLDLESKKGKATGGYCTYISTYRSPYIFSNFNGTSGDIDVLTHEAGHAFQIYSSRDVALEEYLWPTYEACEIHSMSMEFFAWPWMDKFFEEDVLKYKYAHLSGTIFFMPYGCAVDEFQHFVYENPSCGIKKRNDKWLELEKKYLPWRNNSGNNHLLEGTFWQRQSHIFASPFYYIDYVLAEICALQFWEKDNDNHENAWNDYLSLCKKGGTEPFLKLVNIAGLKSPFDSEMTKSISAKISKWLDNIDENLL